jgi:hypothetical protein
MERGTASIRHDHVQHTDMTSHIQAHADGGTQQHAHSMVLYNTTAAPDTKPLPYLELQCCLAVGCRLLRPLALAPGQVLPAWQWARQLLLQAGRQVSREGQLASLGGGQLSTDLQDAARAAAKDPSALATEVNPQSTCINIYSQLHSWRVQPS